MKFIVLFREPDGRKEQHPQEAIKIHQENWKQWMHTLINNGTISGGSGLTLDGCMIEADGATVHNTIHRNGDEIIGGFLLISAQNLDEATAIMKSCPVFEFGGYAEIRVLQNQQ
ncbi:MAG TPA: YciI family protein [Niabella sp.]